MKKKIKNDAVNISKEYGNLIEKFNNKLNVSDISALSKSHETDFT